MDTPQRIAYGFIFGGLAAVGGFCLLVTHGAAVGLHPAQRAVLRYFDEVGAGKVLEWVAVGEAKDYRRLRDTSDILKHGGEEGFNRDFDTSEDFWEPLAEDGFAVEVRCRTLMLGTWIAEDAVFVVQNGKAHRSGALAIRRPGQSIADWKKKPGKR